MLTTISSRIGTLPTSLSFASGLTLLNFYDNSLHGEGLWTHYIVVAMLSAVVRLLFLSYYSCLGTVPSQLASLSVLEAMTVASNNFTGIVPVELCSTAALTSLSFFNNDFTCYPGCLSSITEPAGVAPHITCPDETDIAFCSFVSATNIGSIAATPSWACDSAGYANPSVCQWEGVNCTLGTVQISGSSLTGR